MNRSEITTQTGSSISRNLETIYFSGSIQPHGILLALSDPELRFLFVSANIQEHLGKAPHNLLGQSLNTLLDVQFVDAIKQSLEEIDSVSPIKLQECISVGERSFNGMVHRTENAIILELEPILPQTELGFFSIPTLVKRAIAKLRQVSSRSEFLQLVTQEVRQITGFDRIMVYHFDQQGAGTVMAQAKRDDLPSYLGLHYPATDIPEQVRALYARGVLRFIPDLTAQSIELVPASHPVMQQPLDLSLAVLRGVDPCCVEYHQNMGIAAILVIALINDQKLWGLIACHHQTPKYVPYEVREACELLGQFVSSELAHKVNHEELDYIVKLKSLQSEFVESISQVDNLKQALVNPAPRLLDLVSATGAAVCLEDEITLVGVTPTVEQVRALIQWADTQVGDALFHTNSLPKLYPEATAFKDVASGLLLLQISKVRRYDILWFRPEVLQTVNWAGDPNASITVEPGGNVTLSPRQSFEQWQETVRLTSLSWKACELENALSLRSAIVGIVLNKADELARINQELERSNQELDSFVYAASHDLKEPLRGIHNYSMLLLRGYESVLDDVGKTRLQTLIRLSRRMESLIDVLLKFSRLGQAELHLVPTDINQLVNQVLEDLCVSRQEVQPDIRIPRSLPIVHCDAVLINEVFTNLLSNAFKYNNKAEQWIEIGYLDAWHEDKGVSPPSPPAPLLPCSPSSPTFYVRDNGIGIRARHLETIFRLFKRLHEQHLYGGGTGAGLTIAKKIIERHGGRIWVESTPSVGSTFYFTLGD
ncbi:MAG: GAF domain-containing protein [Iphinoe sp. HA4291-MV1]|jgi:light-regulated signal transduction histidine kinase (bacteriophytochrome)|nr:GAF domain-containing protein [Iphinoe sp. HA4291-MV1]